MTAKRYHKLFRAEMSKLMKGNENANAVIRNAASCTPIWDKVPGRSYQGAWDMVRKVFADMPYNRDTPVPRR